MRLGGRSDVPSRPLVGENRRVTSAAEIALTFPDGREYALSASVSIGRDAANDLVFESPTVSRRHAAVIFRDGRWWIEDRGSYNGTYLNGARLQPGVPMPLRHTDQIQLGSQSLVFSWPAQVLDADSTQPVAESAMTGAAVLSPFQKRVVELLCAPWVAGASLEHLPTNEEIADELGTPGAGSAVKAALSRVYAKAGLTDEPAQTKRRALCRIARQRGWI
jgi:predicted component of type VI protein secretion system